VPQNDRHADKPNILMILVDDLGWRDLACYGSGFYETPVLDRLAREGMRFTDAYASCPVCSPSRASIMTGKYPATVGITNFIYGQAEGKLRFVSFLPHLPLEEFSVARALREGGYATWHVGKWHLGGGEYEPQHHGFDVNIGGGSAGLPRNGYFSPYKLPNLPEGPTGEYLTDRLTDEAIRLIRTHDGRRPFFLNLWHYAVHIPIQVPTELLEKYRRKARDMGLADQPAIVEGEEFPCLHKRGYRIRRRTIQSDPAYAAMMENLDANIGRLLAALEDAGQAENTLVLFTSDNGGLSTAEGSPTCNRPLLEGKGWMYDGGTRVCLLARWPGRIAAGSVCSTPVTSTDFYPTFLDVAGLPMRPSQHVDGASLRRLFLGQSAMERDAIFWHYPHYSNQGGTPGCAIRCGDWKLIEFFEDGRLELYNLREDISEERNLAAEKPQLAAELHARLVSWRNSIEAKIPAPNPEWETKRRLPPEAMDSAYI
jgi:arylsulfatase A-like enzyme